MDTNAKVLAAIKKAGTPVSAGQVAELSKIDRKEVDKAMKALKDSGAIVSPNVATGKRRNNPSTGSG